MTTIFLGVAVAVALACPIHMLWQMRRHKHPECMPRRARNDVEDLRRRQSVLSDQLSELGSGRG